MASTIGTLFVEYRATADKFLADLNKMAKNAKEFERTIKPLRDQALAIGTGMSIVGGAVTTAFIGMARQAANYGDAIRDASIRTGVSTEALSGLKLAAEQTGTSFEGVSGSLARMTRTALAAAQGSRQGAGAFNAIGVSVKDAAGQLRPMEAILGDVADRFAKMRDGTEKAALAQQLFGRNGAVMIEFLNQGREGLAAFQKQAEELGIVIGSDAAAAADKFNDSLNILKNAQLGLSVTIGNLVLPALTKLIELTTGAVVAFRKFAAAHPEVTRAVFILAGVLAGSGGLLVALAGVLAILPKLGAAFALMTGPVGLAVAAVATFVAAMLAFPKFRSVVSDTLKNVIGLFALLGSQIGSIGRALMQLATGQFKNAWDTIKNAGTKSIDDMVSALDAYDDAVGAASSITNLFGTTVKGTQPALEGFGIDLDALSQKSGKAKDEIAELTKSFISTIRPADELSVKLRILLARFDEKDIIRVYRDEIIESATAQRDFGGSVDETITRLERQAVVLKRAQDIIKANREGILDALKPAALPITPELFPAKDMSQDLEFLDMVVGNLGKTTQATAQNSRELFEARERDIENDIKRSERWSRAWSTAVGNISSAFADSVVDTLFSNQKDKTESIEKQITDIKRQQEKERIQAVIDGSRITSVARSNALKQMQVFEKRIQAEDQAERDRNLRRLEGELAHQKNLFARFADSVKRIFADMGKSILKIMISEVFNKVAQAFSKMLGEMLGSVGSWLKSVISETGKATATKAVAGGASGAAGGAVSAGGSVAGGAASAATMNPWVMGGLMVAQILTTAFAGRGRQQRTEENTRETRDWLELMANAWNPLFHKMEYYQHGIWDMMRGGGIPTGTGRIGPGAAALSTQSAQTNAVTVQVTAPLTLNQEFNLDGTGLTTLQIREEIAPELLLDFELGVRGHGEKLAQIIANKLKGLTGTEAPVGI